jgi:DNA (cytosine-5)-methyltransferase 1
MGYHLAGFDVVGVDINPQPHYPFEFHQADAMTFPLNGFDVVHASPPCQDHSSLANIHGGNGTGWMLRATLDRLSGFNGMWVVENVVGAAMPDPVTLCGSAFRLGVRRHRLFSSNVRLTYPGCNHLAQMPKYRVYDHGKWYLSRVAPVYGHGGARAKECWSEAMGIDWMDKAELAQAIPPAYTQYIGGQLLPVMATES